MQAEKEKRKKREIMLNKNLDVECLLDAVQQFNLIFFLNIRFSLFDNILLSLF